MSKRKVPPVGFAEFFKSHSHMGHKFIADHYKIKEKLVTKWRQSAGLKSCRVDYEYLDALIYQGKSTKEIIAITGRSKTAIDKRKRTLGRGSGRHYVPSREHDMPKAEPVYPLPILFERAIRAKARRLGMPMTWMLNVWLKGQGGRQLMGELANG